MIKTLGFFRKKPGMTRAAFVDRYENPEYGHAQFAMKLCPWQEDYRRDFICDTPPITYAHLETSGQRPDFDVVMMTKSRDAAQAQLTADALADPVVGRMIARDEEALFDRTKMTIVNVEERATPQDRLRPRPAGHSGPPALKMLGFASLRDPGRVREELIADYESSLALLVPSLIQEDGQPIFAGYIRNYVNHDAFANQGHVEIAPPKADFDIMNEVWFWSEEDFAKFQAACRDPAVGEKLAVEQSRLLDPGSIRMVFVEEHVHTREMLDAALAAYEAK
jgi:EthD domain